MSQTAVPILPQTNDPVEIQKALLDLAGKIPAAATGPVTGTATSLAQANQVLIAGQIGYETDTKYFKIGDGTTAYNSLSYQAQIPVAPRPQPGPGKGYWTAINGTVGGALYLPVGGTWTYILWAGQNASAVVYFAGGIGGAAGSVAAGGTFLYQSAGWYGAAHIWEIQGPPNPDFTKPVYARPDGSYEITSNGLPFQVLSPALADQYGLKQDTAAEQEFYQEVTQLYPVILAWITAGGVTQPYVSPVPTAEQQAQAAQMQARASLSDLMLQYVNSVMIGPSAPLTQAAAWLAAWKAAGMGG